MSMTVAEAARTLAISPGRLRQLIAAGRVATTRVPGRGPTGVQHRLGAGTVERLRGQLAAHPRANLHRRRQPAPAPPAAPRNQLCIGEAQAWCDRLPPASIDVIWTSPPYNRRDPHRGGQSNRRYGRYADSTPGGEGGLLPEDVYQQAQLALLNRWHTLLTDEGVAFYCHAPRHKAHRLEHPVTWLSQSPLLLLGEIIWDRRGSPNTAPRRFYPQHESIYVLGRAPGIQLDNRERWGDVWSLPPVPHARQRAQHPAPAHPEVVRRCLAAVRPRAAGQPRLVLDCYAGVGTTGLVAQALGLDYLLIERSPQYAARARRALATGTPWWPASAWQPP